MPKILPTCKDGFELNRENGDCRCTRKVEKKTKTTKTTKTRVVKRKTNKKKISKSLNKSISYRSKSVNREPSVNHSLKFKDYIKRMKKIKKTRINKAKKLLNVYKEKSKETSLSINSPTQLLKAQKNYEELGIKAGDWMMDPCYLLRNLKKKLKVNKWTDNLLIKLNNTIPYLDKLPKEKSRNSRYSYGNNVIEINQRIGAGAYGQVCSASIIDNSSKKSKPIVLKLIDPSTDVLSVFTEVIIQMELFCDMRGKFGTGARIPKMEFISRYRDQYIIGMEPLDGTFEKLYKDKKITCREKVKSIQSIAKFLIPLQKNYKFMHRDFHASNIMYKKSGTPGNETYKMYIIDFGMSTALINGQQINKITHIYRIPYKFNPSHDLRLLITFLSTATNGPCMYLFFAMLISTTSILRYKKINNTHMFHHGLYDDAIETLDETFTPENIVKLCDFLLGMSALENEKILVDDFNKLVKHICNKKVYKLSVTNPKTIIENSDLNLKKSDFYEWIKNLFPPTIYYMNQIEKEYSNLKIKEAI